MSNLQINLQSESEAVSLAPRESANFPYRRFGASPLVPKAIRRMAALISASRGLEANYEFGSGMEHNNNQPSDIVDNLAFKELFTFMEQFIEYVGYFRTNPDEGTLHSLKTTLDKLEKLLKEFELHSVEDIRVFVNQMQRILSSYHRSLDVVGYFVDLTGTWEKGDGDPILAFGSKESALELARDEGNEDTRVYEVVANVISRGDDRSSKQIDGDMWLLSSKDIFSCSTCAYQ